MRVAIVGSRNLTVVNVGEHVSEYDEFVSGRSKGTMSVIKYAEITGKECKIIMCN